MKSTCATGPFIYQMPCLAGDSTRMHPRELGVPCMSVSLTRRGVGQSESALKGGQRVRVATSQPSQLHEICYGDSAR